MADAHTHAFTDTHSHTHHLAVTHERLHKYSQQLWQAREVAAKRKRWWSFAFSFTSVVGLQLSKLNELSVPAFGNIIHATAPCTQSSTPLCSFTECLFHRCRLLCCSVNDSYIVIRVLTHTHKISILFLCLSVAALCQVFTVACSDRCRPQEALQFRRISLHLNPSFELSVICYIHICIQINKHFI